MAQPKPADPTFDCLLGTICDFLLPFILVGAGGNLTIARAAVYDLIAAHHPATATELDLVGRILGFSIAAMDNLRLSMGDDLSATKVLRYRSNAVSLSRASEHARKILHALQQNREETGKIPRPSVAAAPTPVAAKPQTVPVTPQPTPAALLPTSTAPAGIASIPPMDIDAMKRDARVMMAAFSKNGPQASTAIAAIPNPDAFTKPSIALRT